MGRICRGARNLLFFGCVEVKVCFFDYYGSVILIKDHLSPE